MKTQSERADVQNHNLANQVVTGYLDALLAGDGPGAGNRLPSVREIGRRLEVSPKTVSRAMDVYVRDGLLEKIQGRGTFIKRRKKRSRTGRIGVMFCHDRAGVFESSFYATIFAGIEEAVNGMGSRVLFSSLMTKDRTVTGIPASVNDEVDGIILVDPLEHVLEAVDADLKKLTVPVVAVNCAAPGREFDIISVDNTLGAVRMVRFLAAAGHRRIACLYAMHPEEKNPPPIFRIRMNAYRQALEEEGLGSGEKRVICLRKGPDRHADDRHNISILKRMMRGNDAPTAVFCTSDDSALYLYRLLPQLGLRIPDDLTVVGFDDLRESAIVVPGLTTVRTPLKAMGRKAVERLSARLKDRRSGADDVCRMLLPVTVVERGSHKNIIHEHGERTSNKGKTAHGS